ncbi:MAG: M56 family metallopeptidase [Roseburia sp.]|nr:M56 family metallopeptidase [Roseburia sp.]
MQRIFEDVIQSISANGVLRYLFDTSVTVSVIVVFLLIIRPLMKKMPRKGMYILWLVAAVRLICPVSIGGIYDMMPEQLGSRVSQTNQNIKIERIASQFAGAQEEKNFYVPQADQRAEKSLYDSQDLTSRDTLYETKAEQAEMPQADEDGFFFPQIKADTWLLIIWGGGVFALFLFMVVSMIRNHRRFSDARQLYDNVYIHPLVDNSFVQGLFSPRIYISEKITEQDREYILCHERKHIKRRDYIVKPVMFALVCVYWFNPFIWIAYHFMMKDMEVSCDEAVIRELGEEARVKYSYLLVSMAVGRTGILNQNAAFSVGVVKDRIVSVMKYRKPTVLTSVVLMLAVVFCGCSIASTPEQAETSEIVQKEEGKIYKESSFFPYGKEEMFQELDSFGLAGKPVLDSKGDITVFPQEFSENGGIRGRFYKYVWNGTNWDREEPSWLNTVAEMYEGKQVTLGEHFYTADGYLYLNIYDDLRPYMSNDASLNKLYKEGEEGEVKGDYETDCYIVLKINEEEGTVETIQIPIEGDYGIAQPIQNFGVLGDGSILNSEIQSIDGKGYTTMHCEVYNADTGQKMVEKDLDIGTETYPHAGEDFFVCPVNNQQTGKVELAVYDPDSGEKEYSLDTGADIQNFTEEGPYGQNFTMGVSGNTILLATREGIFEAEYGDKEFTKIIGGDDANVYYLPQRKYLFTGDMYKGRDGEYMMFRSNSKFREGEDLVCYYEKQ